MTEFMQKIDNEVLIMTINEEESTTNPPVENNAKDSAAEAHRKNKYRRGFNIFQAALFRLRHRPRKRKQAKKQLAKQNNTQWTNYVGSVRPLHLQETASSPPPSIAAAVEISPPQFTDKDTYRSSLTAPPSPEPSYSSGGTMSKYASATSLKSLVDSSDDKEEDDKDEVFDAICGDHMIDAKAEEFINQFYKQIQLQNTAPDHRRSFTAGY